jgi:hypothetical protein
MQAFSISPIEYAGRTYGPGIFDVSDAEFHALGQRGPVRPATQDEIQRAGHSESAAARPETEIADLPRRSGRRLKAAQPV